MDAHAHLLSLGWAGPGHSLESRPHLQQKGRRGLAYDPSRDHGTGRGLVKPLLVSQKKNTFGVGKKTYEPAAGNEWWLKGFENALNKIGKRSSSEATSGTATPETENAAAYRGKHAGLYGFFMKGQQMKGTIDEEKTERLRGRKRKSNIFDDGDHVSTSSESTTPAESTTQNKSTSESKATADFALIGQFCNARDKDRKRKQGRSKLEPAHEFEQVGQFFEARAERKMKRAKKRLSDQSNTGSEADRAICEEFKVERRRERNEQRIENASEPLVESLKEQRWEDKKAAKAKVKSSSIEQDNAWSTWTGNAQAGGSEAKSRPLADDVLRRAERKERKKRKDYKRLAKMQARC
jgi:nucleolar protein TMA23